MAQRSDTDEDIVVELDNTAKNKSGNSPLERPAWQSKKDSFWNKFWYDKRGHQTIVQKPNLWIIGWAATWLASQVLLGSRVSDILSWVAFGLVIVWAALEAIKGDSYFRRSLGILVLLLAILVRF